MEIVGIIMWMLVSSPNITTDPKELYTSSEQCYTRAKIYNDREIYRISQVKSKGEDKSSIVLHDCVQVITKLKEE